MYNLLNKNNDPPPQVEKYLGIKSINLKIMSHLKSQKTVQFSDSKLELTIKF